MSLPRDNMIKALKLHVVPVLRQIGFKGSFPHFRRHRVHQTDLLTFQFSMGGGRFVVEIAKCAPGDLQTSWAVIPANKIIVHYVLERLRLGTNAEHSDYWFKYEHVPYTADESAYSDVAIEVLGYLSQAEEWWA